nr:hypothetical protein [Tanacetum cinerariifolium]
MINMDTMKITATKVETTERNKDDLPGYKNDHKHYKKSDGGFNQKMDQEDLKTYTAAFVIRGKNAEDVTIFSWERAIISVQMKHGEISAYHMIILAMRLTQKNVGAIRWRI